MSVLRRVFSAGIFVLAGAIAGTAVHAQEQESPPAQGETAAEAEEDLDYSRKPSIGALLGILSTGQPDLETSINFGLTAEFRPSRSIGVGLSLSFYSDKNRVQDSFAEYSLVPILLEATYHFGDPQDGGISGFKVGTKQGVIIQSGQITVAGVETDDDATALAFGPYIGYDAFISKTVSLGGEFSVVRMFEDEGSTLTNAVGVVRVWI